MHSRRQDHVEAHRRAKEARSAALLLLGHDVIHDTCGTLTDVEERREVNRLYSMVYLQVRQELKKERDCSGSAQHPINTKPKR